MAPLKVIPNRDPFVFTTGPSAGCMTPYATKNWPDIGAARVASYTNGGIGGFTGEPTLPGVMVGLAGSITPIVTGVIQFFAGGLVQPLSTVDDTNFFQASIRYGTGSAPSAGDADTGTQVGTWGSDMVGTSTGVNGSQNSFSIIGIPGTPLTLGTMYWIDLTFGGVLPMGDQFSLSYVWLGAVEIFT